MRVVRHQRGIPQEKGFLLSDGKVKKIVNRLHGFAADVETCITMSTALSHAMRKAPTRKFTLPPLACLHGEVAIFGKNARQGALGIHVLVDAFAPFKKGFALIKFRFRDVCRHRRIVRGDFVLARIFSGENRGKAGTAKTRRHVAPPKGQALFCKLIDVRCFDLLVPHERIVGPGMVIGNDVNHVQRSRAGTADDQSE